MRTGLPMVLATLAVLFLGYLGYVFWFGGGGRADLQVLEIDGEVVLTRAGQPAQNVEIGASLETDDGLRVGEGGRAVVGVGAETRLTLEEQSSIRVLEVGQDRVRVELEEGRVSALVRPGSPSIGVVSGGRTISTADGAFTARADPDGALAVQTTAGGVSVEGVSGVTRVGAGQRLSDVPGSAPMVGEIPAALLLNVAWPADGPVRGERVAVAGRTEPYARVRVSGGVGGAEARAGPDGSFSVPVSLTEGENELRVEAESVMGETTRQEGAISRDSKAPTATRSQVLWDR